VRAFAGGRAGARIGRPEPVAESWRDGACAVQGRLGATTGGRRAPVARAVDRREAGKVVALPQVSGLHHRYVRKAA
jgi:hypothetical protein